MINRNAELCIAQHQGDAGPFAGELLHGQPGITATGVGEENAITTHPLEHGKVLVAVAVQVDVQTIRDSSLQFVALTELVAHRHLISDGHLLVLLFRLAHALGVIS